MININLFNIFPIKSYDTKYQRRRRSIVRKRFFESFLYFNFEYKYSQNHKNHRIIKDVEYNFIFDPHQFQILEEKQCKHYKGLCVYWCLWYVLFRLNNPEVDPYNLLTYAKFELMNYGVSDYIAKFVNYVNSNF